MRKFVKHKKQPLIDKEGLIEASPNFAHVRCRDRRETKVYVFDLATGQSSQSVSDADDDSMPEPAKPKNHIIHNKCHQNVEPLQIRADFFNHRSNHFGIEHAPPTISCHHLY